TVNWDGSVSPCCGVYLEEEDFGNIFDQGFMQLWNNAYYRTAREFMKKRIRVDRGIKNTCVNCLKIGQINLVLDSDFWIRG
ncbi:MAG: SPASM domain-containing protein, partial [Candidatus Omnitrophica bacterium]|nr:SPASM domain-containing protein [Candidatus Omnitrophota bacterium]